MRAPSATALVVVVVSAAALLTAEEVRAQNFRSVPLGGRTATMGGAGVASGIDAAMPYLNPAGIAGTPYDILSVSADIYSYRSASISNYFRPTGLNPQFGNDVSVSQESFSSLEILTIPSGLSYFKRFGNESDPVLHVLSVSLMAIQSQDIETRGTFRAQGSRVHILLDELGANTAFEYVAGPSYAIRIGKDVRAGVSVFGTLARLKPDEQNLVTISATNAAGMELPSTINTRTTVDAFSIGVTAVAGVQARLYDLLWGGLAVEIPTVPVYGWGDVAVYQDASIVNQTSGQQVTHQVARGNFDSWHIANPARISAGLAYEHPRFAIALDGHMYVARNEFAQGSVSADVTTVQTGMPLAQTKQGINLTYGTATIFDGSVGFEVHVTPEVAVRAGALTDFDAAEARSNGRPNSKLDWYMGTLGVGVKDGTFESTYGIGFRYGVGSLFVQDYLGADSNRIVEVPYHAYGAMLMLSGGVRTSPDEGKAVAAAPAPGAPLRPATTTGGAAPAAR